MSWEFFLILAISESIRWKSTRGEFHPNQACAVLTVLSVLTILLKSICWQTVESDKWCLNDGFNMNFNIFNASLWSFLRFSFFETMETRRRYRKCVCLSVTNFDPNYLMIGRTEYAKKRGKMKQKHLKMVKK